MARAQGCGRLLVGDDQRSGAIGHHRAIRAPQRAGDQRVAVRNRVAELHVERLAHVRVGVVHAVGVVLRGDHRQLFAVIAVALEIRFGDLAEDAREAQRVRLLLAVAAAQQDVRQLPRRQRGHLLGADHERDAAAAAFDEVQRGVQGGGAGGAGVLDMHRRREAQARLAQRHQAPFEALRRQAVVEDAHGNEVDVLRRDAGMVERRAGNAGDQALDIRHVQLAEGCVRPADDDRHVVS